MLYAPRAAEGAEQEHMRGCSEEACLGRPGGLGGAKGRLRPPKEVGQVGKYTPAPWHPSRRLGCSLAFLLKPLINRWIVSPDGRLGSSLI